jgi:formylglycine-generating enzyme required for sulfatase activity
MKWVKVIARVSRGGSWAYTFGFCRSASRSLDFVKPVRYGGGPGDQRYFRFRAVRVPRALSGEDRRNEVK